MAIKITQKNYLTVTDCMRELQVSRATVLQLIVNKRLKAFKFGKKTHRIRIEDLKKYVESSATIKEE